MEFSTLWIHITFIAEGKPISFQARDNLAVFAPIFISFPLLGQNGLTTFASNFFRFTIIVFGKYLTKPFRVFICSMNHTRATVKSASAHELFVYHPYHPLEKQFLLTRCVLISHFVPISTDKRTYSSLPTKFYAIVQYLIPYQKFIQSFEPVKRLACHSQPVPDPLGCTPLANHTVTAVSPSSIG